MNSMKAPKILPWIARKAGISDELALKLWRRAVSEAEYLTGKQEGNEFNELIAIGLQELTQALELELRQLHRKHDDTDRLVRRQS